MAGVVLMLISCSQSETKSVEEAVKVRIVDVDETAVGNVKNYSGTVVEEKGVSVSFATVGTVQKVLVSVGDKVKKGQLIAVLDDEVMRQSHEAANVSLKQAEDAYGRMKQLKDSNSLAEIQWIEIESKLKQAQAAEAIARKSLSDCMLYAPESGVVADKMVEAGQNVTMGMPVIKLVDIRRVKVKVAVPETEIANIKEGMTVDVFVAALQKHVSGKVTERGVSANPLTRTYDVYALVENETQELLPGMICEVGFRTGDDSRQMTLPANVLRIDENNRSFVWLAVSGKAHKRYVTIDGSTERGVVIAGGLQAGDKVISDGSQKVSENTKVEIVK